MMNRRGFVLAETLVVAIAVVGIFSLLYANYYPLIGEYEKREVYDDIDAKYASHWVRKILVEKKINNNAFNMTHCGGTCHILYAAYYYDKKVGEEVIREKRALIENEIKDGSSANIFQNTAGGGIENNSPYMQNYITANNIRAIIITRYNITDFKNHLKNNQTVQGIPAQSANVNKYIFNRGFREYIDYLPRFTTPSENGAGYRVFIIMDHNTSKEYDSYGTIEVKI